MKEKKILGLTFGHGDSAAALVIGNRLICAAEEERFNRVKHSAAFPEHSIRFCLEKAGIQAAEIDIVAIPHQPLNAFGQKIKKLWQHPHLLFSKLEKSRNQALPSLAVSLKKNGLGKAHIKTVEHHLAHLASSRFLLESDSATLISIDGMGDHVSATFGKIHLTSKENRIQILQRVHFPHSLGYFYTALTQYLGFPHYGDEFKVMALASFGKPRYLPILREWIREVPQQFQFTLHPQFFPIEQNPPHLTFQNGTPVCPPLFHSNYWIQALGLPPRRPRDPITEKHYDLAASVQLRFEEVANHLLREAHQKIGGEELALSGGCAHNSVWVGKIPTYTPFKKIKVASASHDAGTAIGAAASLAHGKLEADSIALLGPSPQSEIAIPGAKKFQEEDLVCWIIDRILEQKIVGICRGAMEFGPRALGNRSLFADPRSQKARDNLNQRIKHREWFRPFAAAIQYERQEQWLKNSFYSPTMEAVFELKQPQKTPAIAHVDQTCRIQSVTSTQYPFLWKLLERFREKTGVPMLLNTSFNDQEPIVCTAEDSMQTFQRGGFDVLVIENSVWENWIQQRQDNLCTPSNMLSS